MAEDGRNGHYGSVSLDGPLGKGLKKSLGIDTRYSVLDIIPAKEFLYVFTDSVGNAKRVSRFYQKFASGIEASAGVISKIKIVLLPDKSVGKLTKGVCHVGVAPVRKSNDSTGEQITQVLYGESFDTLQIAGDWIRVRLNADGYIGWVSADQVTLFDENSFYQYRSLQRKYVAKKEVSLFEQAKDHSSVIREAVFGSALAITGERGGFFEVKLPDGPSAYVEKSGIRDFSPVRGPSVKKLINMARAFQGTSYVWGGRSAKGFDCSGFVQTVFRFNGIELPRDSDRQFTVGEPLGNDLRSLRPGDLLFFSYGNRKVSHVALYIGEGRKFIHSSGYVRINSLDPMRNSFNEKLYSTFIGACRIAQ
jgi:cell wall-associated NlpC family hydrolase